MPGPWFCAARAKPGHDCPPGADPGRPRRRGVAFVEVKRRDTLDQALNAVAYRQRRRIARAAAFLARRPLPAGLDLRFDVMTVVPGNWPRHIMDA